MGKEDGRKMLETHMLTPIIWNQGRWIPQHQIKCTYSMQRLLQDCWFIPTVQIVSKCII